MLKVKLTIHTFLENQTIRVLRTIRTLQTFGESLITQVLRMVMIMALQRTWKWPGKCSTEHLQSSPRITMRVSAPWAPLGEKMLIILKALKCNLWRWLIHIQVLLTMAM